MECKYCSSPCIKKGKQSTGRQKYYCGFCKKYQQEDYMKKAYQVNTNDMIVKLTCNGCGIRSTAMILEISATTVIERIKMISQRIGLPSIFLKARRYEVDELKTYVQRKKNEFWVCCTLDKENGQIMSLSVGKRTTKTLQKALRPILLSQPARIHSDKLKQYRSIINKKIHRVKIYTINKIERRFLNFRTHLKRLTRRTICFSKTVFMLEAVLKIYLWFTQTTFLKKCNIKKMADLS